MGKNNANANREKKNHFKEGKDAGGNREQQMIDEAAKLGCEVWELEQKLAGENSDSDEEGKAEEMPDIKEAKKEEDSDEEEQDSDDDELDRLYGKADNKNRVVEEPSSSEDEDGMPKEKKPEAVVAKPVAKDKKAAEEESSEEEEVVPVISKEQQDKKEANRNRLEMIKKKRELDAEMRQ